MTAKLALDAARPDPASVRPAGTQRNLELQVSASPDVLVRVLGLLRCRRCRVVQVDFVARDRHYPGRLVIGVEAPAGRAHCVEAWLANLVDVLAVDSI
jgi:acetolactate synthase regulatory subunit